MSHRLSAIHTHHTLCACVYVTNNTVRVYLVCLEARLYSSATIDSSTILSISLPNITVLLSLSTGMNPMLAWRGVVDVRVCGVSSISQLFPSDATFLVLGELPPLAA